MHAEWPIACSSKAAITTSGCSSIASASSRASSTSATWRWPPRTRRRPASSMTIHRDGDDVRAGRSPPAPARAAEGAEESAGEEVMTMPMRSLRFVLSLAMLVVALPACAQAPAASSRAAAPAPRAAGDEGRSADAAAELRIRAAGPARSVRQPGRIAATTASDDRRGDRQARRRRARHADRRADGARHRADARRVGGDGVGPRRQGLHRARGRQARGRRHSIGQRQRR